MALSIAIMHHPLEWLSDFERGNIKTSLREAVDIVLHGHLHETDVESVVSIKGGSLHLYAGAAYQTRKYPQRAMYATFDGQSVRVLPIRYEDSPDPIWTVDTSLFPKEDGFSKSFGIPRLMGAIGGNQQRETAPTQPASVSMPRFRSNIPSLGNLPFMGHDQDLKDILKALGDTAKETVLVLHGQPGVGKSELAREFARQNKDRYPGGTFFIDAGGVGDMLDFVRIGSNQLGLSFAPNLSWKTKCAQTFYALGEVPTLLIYDNPQSMEAIADYLPPTGMACHVLVTSVGMPCKGKWADQLVEALSKEVSLELIERLAGNEVVERVGDDLAKMAEGIPMQLVPASTALAYEARHGRLDKAQLTLSKEANNSFSLVYQTLENPARLLLHAASYLALQRIARHELAIHMHEAFERLGQDFDRLVDMCNDLHLLEDGQVIRMHRLFAMYLRQRQVEDELWGELAKIRSFQRDRMLEVAENLADHPQDIELASLFLTYTINPEDLSSIDLCLYRGQGEKIGKALLKIGRFDEAKYWYMIAFNEITKKISNGSKDYLSVGSIRHMIGFCLSSLGRFTEAKTWFEKAVNDKKLLGEYGPVDHSSLASSLHQVGYCLSGDGHYAEAQPWFEQAVKEAIIGDLENLIDYVSLGSSRHQVGYCLSRLHNFQGALKWFRLAVTDKKHGDLNKLVDKDSLGSSMHQVGYCLSSLGRYNSSIRWVKDAVKSKAEGDLHGRINHISLSRSLYQVGYCLLQSQKYVKAKPWFEQAISEANMGDIYGRIDHESLGISKHQVGYCLSSIGHFTEAQTWYERAVKEKEQGDIHGRIDHDSLGSTLHQVGYCLGSLNHFAEAQPWYERAIKDKKQGDIHGKLDHDSLGRSLTSLAVCLEKLGKQKKASVCRKLVKKLAG